MAQTTNKIYTLFLRKINDSFHFNIIKEDFILEESVMSVFLNEKNNFVYDTSNNVENSFVIKIVTHSACDLLRGQPSKKDNVYDFAQCLLEKSKDKEKQQYPIIHITLIDMFVDSLYGNDNLPILIPRSFQIMDSSIWNYLVPLCDIQYKDSKGDVIEIEKFQDVFYKAVDSIFRNYEKHLYDLHVAKEYADLNARIVSEAYLSGSHAVGVSPFIFHSEKVTKRLIDKEFKNDNSTIELIKERKWRILLVDDKAIKSMDNDRDDHLSNSWNCKLTIIKQLLKKQFDLTNETNNDTIIPSRPYNQVSIDNNEKDFSLSFNSAITKDELKRIFEEAFKITDVDNIFKEEKLTEEEKQVKLSSIKDIANKIDDNSYSYLPMFFEEINSQSNILYTTHKDRSDLPEGEIIELFEKLSFSIKDVIRLFSKKLWGFITKQDEPISRSFKFEVKNITKIDKRKSYNLRIILKQKIEQNKESGIKNIIKSELEKEIKNIKDEKKLKGEIRLSEIPVNSDKLEGFITEIVFRLIYFGDFNYNQIQSIEKRIRNIQFNIEPYSHIKLSCPKDWKENEIMVFKNLLIEKINVSVLIEENSPFIIEYAETEQDAMSALQSKKYDIVLLDYLLKDNNGNHYGYQILEDISKHATKDELYKAGLGPNGKMFFLFISAYSSAVYERLLAEGLNQTEDYWQIAIGACPTNTPQLFLYNLIKLMENRLEHSGILKLTSRNIYNIVKSIYSPKEGSVRKSANNKYQEVLSLQYHYRKMLRDVDIPEGNSIFDTKGSVLITDFIRKNVNLGGMLEHLNQLVHLTAFGTIRQWPEMWEEYIYFKGQFQAQNDLAGVESITENEFREMARNIEDYIKTLKNQ